MTSVRPDPSLAPPAALSQRRAEQEAIRFATLELIDRRRSDPLRLAGPIPASMPLAYRGGLHYRGRPTFVWRFRVPSTGRLPALECDLIGVQAQRQSYFAAYAVVGDSADAQDATLSAWISGDWRAYSARERILSSYRQRLQQKPEDAARHYELALIGVALGASILAESKADALYHPGPLDEFQPSIQQAIARAPGKPKQLALAAFLHERLAQFPAAAQRYGEAMAAEPKSALYAFLCADALLFAGDPEGARAAGQEATQRAIASKNPYRFGIDRSSLVDVFREILFQDAWTVRRKVEGLQRLESDKERAEADRRAIEIDPRRVPVSLHDLIPVAMRWGLGDDASRAYFISRASAKEKATLKNAVTLKRRAEIQAWLDTLGPRQSTGAEAGAFLYLLETLDEMGV